MALGRGSELEARAQKPLAALSRDSRKLRAAHVVVQHPLEPRLKSGLCSRQRDAGPQATEYLHPAGAAVQETVESPNRLGRQPRGDPYGRNPPNADAAKSRSRAAHPPHPGLI